MVGVEYNLVSRYLENTYLDSYDKKMSQKKDG
jgi:hypothetical protein